MKVLKFGGSSVATTDLVKKVAINIKNKLKDDKKLIVVVSAMGKTTNELIEKLKSVANKFDFREYDQLLATGEMQSVALLANALSDVGVRAKSLAGWQAGIVTNNDYTKAFITKIEKHKIISTLKNFDVAVVAGFQGVTTSSDITTLGRGGSDTTAVALASVFGCPCEIYTDVNGVCTIDPKIFHLAKKLNNISYDEMITMSVNGAKVLETRCAELAKKFDVNLYLGKSLEEFKGGTYIVKKNNELEDMPIKAIALKSNLCVASVKINKDNHLELIRKILSQKIDFETISITQNGNFKVFHFYFSKYNLKEVNSCLANLTHKIKKDVVKLTLVGCGVQSRKSTTLEVLNLLKSSNVDFNNVVVGEMSLSFSIDEKHTKKIAKSLANKFEL